ncbi:MAG: inositol monophosphatase family protein [Cyanobacteria bacterium P01_A01_bin.84]
MELQSILDIATETALGAGAVLRNYLGKLEDSVEEKGRPGDLVTVADKASEAVILESLRRHFPDHAILAEESGKLGNQDSKYLWAIDPLDGTTNYAHQYPAFAVSIGLLVDGELLLGVIYDPLHDELFRGAQGLGATRNRRVIKVSQTQELSKSLLVTGFAYDRRETSDNNYAEFCHLTHITQGVRRGGSAALDLSHVACGRLDGYWERGLSPWDISAGIIILREAGGQVSAYDNSPIQLESGRILATNGHIHGSLSKELQNVPSLASWGK